MVQCPRFSGAASAQGWRSSQAGLSPHSVPPLCRPPWIASIAGSQRLVPTQANRSSLGVPKRRECFGSPNVHVPGLWFERVVPVIGRSPPLLVLEERGGQTAHADLQTTEADSPSPETDNPLLLDEAPSTNIFGNIRHLLSVSSLPSRCAKSGGKPPPVRSAVSCLPAHSSLFPLVARLSVFVFFPSSFCACLSARPSLLVR